MMTLWSIPGEVQTSSQMYNVVFIREFYDGPFSIIGVIITGGLPVEAAQC